MLAYDLYIAPGITSVIGGGGKTTLIARLATELAENRAKVIVATSTKMHAPQTMPVFVDPSVVEVRDALMLHNLICVGGIHESGKMCAPELMGLTGPIDPQDTFLELAKLADYVLVEADGSKGLPLKAHGPQEPVIPQGSTQSVYVIGADGFDRPIAEVCHRPELYAGIAGLDVTDKATPEVVARVLAAEALHDRVFINKCEDDATRGYAAELADLLDRPVLAGSLAAREHVCLRS